MYKKAELALTLTRGDYFDFSFRWKVAGEYVDLSGWDARFQVRRTADADQTIISLVGGDGIELTSDGWVTCLYPVDNELPLGVFTYDFEFIPPNGRVFTPFSGSFTIVLGATN